MIVTKTPLRISFFGGGSDIPEYYNQNEGMVISTSIDKYINLAVNRGQLPHIRVVYSEAETVSDVNEIKHDRVRELLKHFKINSHIEICSFSDVSTKGTGLGSSSTFTVGLAAALMSDQTGLKLNKKAIAELACLIEIDKCKEPIGKQDQYAAAYGGFNIIKFGGNSVECIPFSSYGSVMMPANIEKNLLCFGTNITRKTSDILTKQVDNLKKGDTIELTVKMVDIAEYALKRLLKHDVDGFGSLLNDTWNLKKQLAPNISNPYIDEMYELGIKSGALGGKLLGAGGGGYMLFYVPKAAQNTVIEIMTNAHYPLFNFQFDHEGTKALKI